MKSKLRDVRALDAVIEAYLHSIRREHPALRGRELALFVDELFRDAAEDLFWEQSTPILDEILSHFQLPENRRFEYSQLYKKIAVEQVEPSEPIEIETQKKKRERFFAVPEDLCMRAPGLVGELTHWICETAYRRQPALALGAALCAVGSLKGHRVKSFTGLRTNLFLVGLADSGSGKDHPRKQIANLFRAAGVENILLGEPASDSALIRSLETAGGVGLLQWDEFGHALSAIMSDRAAGHEMRVISALLQIWSSADSYFIGKEYADRRNERIEIDQPCLSVWGTTVPSRFYDALSSESVVDGFLPRFLVLDVEDPDVPGRLDSAVGSDPDDVPALIVEQIRRLSFLPKNVRAQGNLDAALAIRPAVVDLREDARGYFREVCDYFEQRKQETRESGHDALYSRGQEHLQKIALTVCDGPEITREHLEWAFEFVNGFLAAAEEAFAANLENSQWAKRVESVREFIGLNPGVKKMEILRRFRFSIKEFEGIIEYLRESQYVVERKEEKSGRGRPASCYFLSKK